VIGDHKLDRRRPDAARDPTLDARTIFALTWSKRVGIAEPESSASRRSEAFAIAAPDELKCDFTASLSAPVLFVREKPAPGHLSVIGTPAGGTTS
jgi:hypothetical protein